MRETSETTTVRTLVLNEQELEKIVRDSLGPEWANAQVMLYQDTLHAGQVMGAIDDVKTIACEVKLTTKILT